MKILLKIVALSLLLAGCSVAKGPKFTSLDNINKDISVLYFFRPNLGYWQSAYTPWLELDGMEFADMHKGGYTRIYVEAGKYNLALKTNMFSGNPDLEGSLIVKKGERRFFEILDPVSISRITSLRGESGYRSTWSSFMNEVSKSEALPILKELKLDKPSAFNKIPTKKLVTSHINL